MSNLNVIFSFCREINGEKKNFCLVTNPRKKLKYRMFTEAESKNDKCRRKCHPGERAQMKVKTCG